ncbi:MAG: ABC transporter permease [Acidobacteriota bacterium]
MIGFGVRKLWARFSRARIEHQMEEEIRFHLEMETQANQAMGMPAGDARRVALVDFGGADQTRETVRDVYATFWDSLLQDIRFALRMFRRNRGFTLAAVITLALGIGAATCIFSVVDATLFRPLPYAQPDRLVRIMGWIPDKASYYEGVPKDYFAAFRKAHSFEGVSAYTWYPSLPILLNPDGAENVIGSIVSPNLLRTLATQVLHGRDFRPDEETRGNDRVVILTYGAWQRRFGGDLKAIGLNLSFADGPRTVVGVLPEEFRYPSIVSSWTPEMLIPWAVDWTKVPSSSEYYLLARLKSGIRLSEAQAEVDVISSRNNSSLPQAERGYFRLIPLQEHLVKYKRTDLLLLFGAIMCLPLIGCLNVSNMLLAKGLARKQEMGIRIALGAGRARLARQLLTESLLLSLAGGILGVLLSFWILPGLLAQFPSTLRLGLNDIAIDGRVLMFSLALTIVTTVIHGLWPAWSASRTDIAGVLRKGDSRCRRIGAEGFKPALLIVESALAMVLLVGAGLIINSFVRLGALSVGFRTDNLCRVNFYLSEKHYPSIQSVLDFNQNMRDRIRAIAGVAEVAAVDYPPLREDRVGGSIVIPGHADVQNLDLRHVTAEYFAVLGMPCVSGRLFTVQDEGSAPRVAVINASMARRYWPGMSPLGQTIVVDKKWPVQVVGIVPDVRERSVQEDPRPSAYVPVGDPEYPKLRSLTFVIRTATDNPAVYRAIADQAKAADIRQVIEVIKYSDSFAFRSQRFYAILFGICAAFAVTLVGIGIAGITAYSVSQRTFEIGMRLALGAKPHQVVLMFMWRSILAVCAGLLLGAAAALLVTRMLASLLYKVTPTDPLTIGVSLVSFVAVASLAAYVPARNITHIDPMVALRTE